MAVDGAPRDAAEVVSYLRGYLGAAAEPGTELAGYLDLLAGELARLRKAERQRNKLARMAGVDLVEFDTEDWDL